ncbi:hypothetical protein K2X33_15270 [bacterium]|nr:hypothetical protein [bacterium]
MDRRTLFLILCIGALDILMLTFGPHPTLDTKLYYTGDEARALLGGFDASQTHAYFLNELFDLLLIASYSALFYRLKVFVPFLPGAFDLVETSYILYALKTPGAHGFLDYLGVVTFLKWVSGGVLVVSWLRRKVRKAGAGPR